MSGAELKGVYDEVARCNRCGWCQPVCPIYWVTGNEGSAARGHNALIRGIIEGKLGLLEELEDYLFECLLCKACVSNCFPKVKSDEIIVFGRSALLKEKGQPLSQRFLFHNLMQNPERFSRFVRLISLTKDYKLSALVGKLGVMGWLSRGVERAGDILPPLPTKFLRERLSSDGSGPEDATQDVAYFVGCGINFLLPEVGEATLSLLAKEAWRVYPLDNLCCGLPPYSFGDLGAARALAKRNLLVFKELLNTRPLDVVVTDCGSCSSFLKRYPDLLRNEPESYLLAKDLSKRVKDVNEFLTLSGLEACRRVDPSPIVVTYHDPCHLSRYQSLSAESRSLLKALKGVTFKEMPEADWCCGGAGSYSSFHYQQSMKVLERKMDNLEQTGADTLVTSCPSCILQLSYGVRKRGLTVKVLHISQLLASGLKTR